MFLKIPLLQRYILFDLLRVFVFVLGSITILLMFVGVFQMATEKGLEPLETLKLLPFVVPSMLPFTIPAAMLLTVCVVYGRLAGDQEVVAAKAAGVHPLALMWPALVLGGMLSLASLVLTDQVIPWSWARIEQRLVSMFEKIFLDRLRTDLQFSYPPAGLHVTVAGVDGNRLHHPIFMYHRGNRVYTLEAEEATLDLDVRRQLAVIHMRNGLIDIGGEQRVSFREKTESLRWEPQEQEQKPRHLPIETIDQEIKNISSHREQLETRRAIDACFCLTMAEFDRLVETQRGRLQGMGGDSNRYFKLNTEVYSRYALACSCFFFALLGTPYSMRYGRRQYLTSFLICFIPIVAGYYPLMLGLMTQAKKGHLSPEWSMWIANAFLGLIALAVMRRVIRY